MIAARAEGQKAFQTLLRGLFAGRPQLGVQRCRRLALERLGQWRDGVAVDLAPLGVTGRGLHFRCLVQRQTTGIDFLVPALGEGGEDAVVIALAGQQLSGREGQHVGIAMQADVAPGKALAHAPVALTLIDGIFVIEVQGLGAQLVAQCGQCLGHLGEGVAVEHLERDVIAGECLLQDMQAAAQEVELVGAVAVLDPLRQAGGDDGHDRAACGGLRESSVVVYAQVTAQPDQLQGSPRWCGGGGRGGW